MRGQRKTGEREIHAIIRRNGCWVPWKTIALEHFDNRLVIQLRDLFSVFRAAVCCRLFWGALWLRVPRHACDFGVEENSAGKRKREMENFICIVSWKSFHPTETEIFPIKIAREHWLFGYVQCWLFRPIELRFGRGIYSDICDIVMKALLSWDNNTSESDTLFLIV